MSKSEERANQDLLPENVAKIHFPEGVRVLAVDDNIVCLKLLAALLQKCGYQVTTTTKATEALEMLRKKKENYDIVITDVKMLDMDGFELLEIIGLEMDIPVLMMSANDDTESVMKGVMHGARDYLLKPVRIEELKNIWQHVIRKTLFDPSKSNITKGEMDQNSMHWKRQREKSIEKEDETNTQSDGESCAQKKQRIAWTSELHKKFVAAVQRLEVDKAVPKKILELMNDPHLTRENVASHLQKYRNMLRKEKNKTSTSEDSNTNVNLNRRHGHVPDTTIVPSNNQGLHTINRVGDHRGNNAEMMSFRDHHLPKTETFGTPFVNQRPMFLPLIPQEMLLHQNLLHPNIEDQIRPAMPIPMLRNVSPAPILVANPRPHPGYNGTKLHSVHSWRKVVDDYVEISSHVPSFGATGQLGPSAMPLVGFAPYSSSPGAFNFAGTPLQMRGEAPISQLNSLVEPIRSSLPMQNDRGRNLVTLSGRGALDFRERTCRFQIDNRSPFVDDLAGNGQIRSVQPPPETSERENNGHRNSCSSSDDDDLSIMVKEFGNNSAPEL